MQEHITNILIAGVGGQGVLLASELLSDAAFLSGSDVKKSEVHGMAQRGGVVTSHVRFGIRVYSPLIPSGQADVLLAFEEAEAKRWMYFVKTEGRIVINQKRLKPPVAFLKGFEYPADPVKDVKENHGHVLVVPATEIATTLGNPRTANMVLLGALSGYLEITDSLWENAIRNRVPAETVPVNLDAFHEGRKLTS
ncbi:indolepyruvate oxidoreductase subunit beta [bacterium]|nr:indolepyruvate oxidoreductase subunit beta [bacterium]